MQATVYDAAAERRVLLACIVSNEALAGLAGRTGPEPFRSKWSNLIWGWCEKYHLDYGEAPGRIIESLYERWSQRSTTDKDVIQALERFLLSLSEEYERSDEVKSAHALRLAEDHFNEVRLERLREALEDRVQKGRVDDALADVAAFARLDLRTPPSVDVLKDKGKQRHALEAKQQVLIRLPGAAGEFFGEELAEDSFVACMAQAKGGKSFLLLHLAWMGMKQGNRVAYFQVGDLSEAQIMRRFMRRALYRPLDARSLRWPKAIMLPSEGRGLAVVEHEQKTFTKPVVWEKAEKALAQAAEKAKGSLRLSYHPIKTVSVADIKNVLSGWDKEGWQANVVVVDYAGNLAPADHKANPIEQTANTWAMLRQLSEMRKCLVVTANQSNKEGFSAWVLTRKNFADSKMILAHVTAFLGVNVTDEEKIAGVIRYNFIVRREEQFSETHCLYCAPCLAVANPIVCCVVPEWKGE